MNTGFIGLGMMGNPMAQNILKAGQPLTVFDLNPEALKQCADLGATVAKAVDDLARCELVFIIVNTGEQLEQVLFGADPLISESMPGQPQTIVVMSTVSPKLIRAVKKRIDNPDITLIDAPVSGGPIIAELGQLSFMIGGADEETMARLQPYLDAMGKDIFTIGELGTGLAVKLINNVVAIGNAYIFTEVLALAVEASLDVDRVVEVMSASSGQNWCTENWDMFKAFMSLLLTQPSFQQTAEKDINTAIEWSQDLKLDVPALEHVRSILLSSPGFSDQLKAALLEQ